MSGARAGAEAPSSRPTTELVWRELTKASFAIVSYTTPTGEPRSSGVVYAIDDRRMYVAVAGDSWKARHIGRSGQVAVTVPVRRGGVMSLLLPIPPATISFHGSATVHPATWMDERPLPKRLASLLPAKLRTTSRIIEIRPAGQFLTYGLGVSLMQLRKPAVARGRAPVE
jgi:hypothetical protein